MSDTSGAAADMFTGTAHYYARYRLPYPQELMERIVAEFGLDGNGRLLDLGCGTGQIAIPLHRFFEEVAGIDTDPDMIAEAEEQGRQAGATNIRWRCMPAEQLSPEMGVFRLVTIGSAFHWMDRPLVLERCHALLSPGGGIALLDMGSFWGGQRSWEQAVVRVVQRWLGAERRAGSRAFPTGPRHQEVVAQSAFTGITTGEAPLRHTWDIPSIIGHLYTTSYANRGLLGDNVPAFEADLRDELLRLDPSGAYEQTATAGYIFAHKS